MVTGGRIGRWPLAIVCAVVGFAFTAVQDVGDWVTYSDHSARAAGRLRRQGHRLRLRPRGRLLGVRARVRSGADALDRSALRAGCRWRGAPSDARGRCRRSRWSRLLAAGSAGRASPARAAAATPHRLPARRPEPGRRLRRRARAGVLAAVLGLGGARAGRRGPQPGDVGPGAAACSPTSRRRRHAARRRLTGAHDPGRARRRTSPRSFGGRDLVAALERDIRRDGSVSEQVNLTAFAVLALRAAGVAPAGRMLGVARPASRTVTAASASPPAAAAATSTTPAPRSRRSPARHERRRPRRAVAFIRRQQNPDGGFPSQPGGESNAQSTAWAVQGLIAAGVDPGSLHRRRGSPLQYLRSLIAPDGHVRYSRSERSDARVGDRAGADGARPQAPAARAGRPAARGRHHAPQPRGASPPRRRASARRRPAPGRMPGGDQRPPPPVACRHRRRCSASAADRRFGHTRLCSRRSARR